MSDERSRSLIKNASWLTVATAGAKAGNLVQTVVLARLLGITDYGVYGFLMSTFGLTASLTGLQLGLTNTVFISRHRESHPEQARIVFQQVTRFASVMGLGVALGMLVFARPLSIWLLNADDLTVLFAVGISMVPLSVSCGVLDGALNGFEDFRAVAVSSVTTSLLTLAFIFPAAKWFSLLGALLVTVLGLFFRFIYLRVQVQRHIGRLPTAAVDSSALSEVGPLIRSFALPSMLTTFAMSGATWYGSYLLSRVPGGFSEVAVANVGIQWRTPLALLAGVVGSVAVPAMSSHFAQGRIRQMNKLRSNLVLFTGLGALLGSLCIVAASPWLLEAYGKGFAGSELAFSLIVASTVPQTVAQGYLQQLVAEGRGWRLLRLSLLQAVPNATLFALLVSSRGLLGYGVSLLASWTFFAVFLILLNRRVPAAAI